MALGNLAALVRPPEQGRKEGDLDKAPMTRSVIMMVIGSLAALWALATLITG